MAAITAPALKIQSVDWSLDRPAQANASVFSSIREVNPTPLYGKWYADVTLCPIVGEANFLLVRSFLAKVKGSLNTFQLIAVEGAQNSNSGVTVSGTPAAGATTMNIAGAATALLAGQFVTLNGQLLQLTADQSGSTLTFEPPLRAGATNGTAVETSQPYATVRMSNSQLGWSVDAGQVYNVKFSAEEAF
jgi:hypothetical protein